MVGKLKTRTAFIFTAVLAVGACADTAVSKKNEMASLVPPSIGEQDDLRRGEAPPAKPDDVRIAMYNPDVARAGSDVTKIRGDALQETAQSYGSQMGYARRSYEITGRLEVRSGHLSEVFDFNRVVSAAPVKAGVIVPPVVSRSFNAFTVDDLGTEASVADEYLTIIRPGKIAPIPPTWRDYLVFTAPAPDEPARSLMPTEKAELALFNSWFDQGWSAGVELADAEFSDRLTRLQRDFTGMLQYRRLVAHGMMDRMVLADADFGVTGENGEMRIGSRTVQITSEAEFQTDPTQWQVRSVSARDALIVDTGEIPSISSILY